MAISEFRFNKKRKHPAYVFKQKDGKYHSLTITHSKKHKKKNTQKLYKNPSPKDTSDAYVVKKVVKDDISAYGKKPLKNWGFHTYDRRNIKKLKKGKKV